ncbi:MAG: zinc-binding dehydrogenase [Hadesarchaea archaeon]|nr:zinc-binding dehydrogenase [Hadesarchaea archaeon]
MVKAAVMSEPGKLEVKSFDLPKLAENAILVRIKACGVCGTDVHLFRGHMKSTPFPIIPGHEFSGVVEELGPKANESLNVRGGELQRGDRVTVVPGLPCGKCYYCRNLPHYPNLCTNRLIYGVSRTCERPPHLYGGYAEYIYIEPGSWVYKLPDGMAFEVAALAEPMAVATRALERAFAPGVPFASMGFGVGTTVVVQGTGAIGLLTIAAAKVAGAGKVIAVERVKQRLRMAKRMGADEIVDMRELRTQEERVKRVLELTDGVGADVVVECTGVPAAVPEGLEMVRRGGKYVEVGHFTDPGSVEIRPHVICYKDMDVLGSWVYPLTQFREALAVLNSGRFPFKDLFTHRFKIENALKAIQASEKGECIKAMIAP